MTFSTNQSGFHIQVAFLKFDLFVGTTMEPENQYNRTFWVFTTYPQGKRSSDSKSIFKILKTQWWFIEGLLNQMILKSMQVLRFAD